MHTGQTVAAVSTAYGKGGVALIRISGESAFEVAKAVFRPKKTTFEKIVPRRAVFGDLLRKGKVVDQGLCLLFPAASSFTGEDTAELTCHGGILLTELLLEACFEAGALPADGGEFTFRAWMNGRLSLSEAESIPDLIDAQTEEKVLLAARNAGGEVEKKLDSLRGGILSILAPVYAYIDYPDMDLSDLPPEEMKARLLSLKKETGELLDTYRAGKAVCEGIPCAILGSPNAGKSSLLNLLCGEDRAIVTPSPGTTRDVLEVPVSCGRLLLRLMDTAGIRETGDEIEAAGVERAKKALKSASLVLFAVDASRPLTENDLSIASLLPKEKETVVLLNKSDLPRGLTKEDEEKLNSLFPRILPFSAKTGEGKKELEKELEALYRTDAIDRGAVVTGARLAASLKTAGEALGRAVGALDSGFPPDVASLDVEAALSALDGKDGRETAEEVVREIFSRFCVGK